LCPKDKEEWSPQTRRKEKVGKFFIIESKEKKKG
jgi:hypothetical protein